MGFLATWLMLSHMRSSSLVGRQNASSRQMKAPYHRKPSFVCKTYPRNQLADTSVQEMKRKAHYLPKAVSRASINSNADRIVRC